MKIPETKSSSNNKKYILIVDNLGVLNTKANSYWSTNVPKAERFNSIDDAKRAYDSILTHHGNRGYTIFSICQRADMLSIHQEFRYNTGYDLESSITYKD